MELDQIRFDEKGLVPAIAQDVRTGQVLMLAYMNRESLEETLRSGYATYFSRSRQQLWKKGETSGHVQKVLEIMDAGYSLPERKWLPDIEKTAWTWRAVFFAPIEERVK